MRRAWQHVLETDRSLEIAGVCESIEEAVLLCRNQKPDIAVVNISLNYKPEIEALGYFLNENPEVKVIGISMNIRPVVARSFLDTGGHGFITKSSPKEEIIAAVHLVVKGEKYISKEIWVTKTENKL